MQETTGAGAPQPRRQGATTRQQPTSAKGNSTTDMDIANINFARAVTAAGGAYNNPSRCAVQLSDAFDRRHPTQDIEATLGDHGSAATDYVETAPATSAVALYFDPQQRGTDTIAMRGERDLRILVAAQRVLRMASSLSPPASTSSSDTVSAIRGLGTAYSGLAVEV